MRTIALAALLLILTAAPLLASADLTLTPISPGAVVRAGYTTSPAVFNVPNAGPDVAANVVATIKSSLPASCFCSLGDIRAGQSRTVFMSVTAPDTAGWIGIDASITSSTTDPNPADNSASTTLTVSTDPDVSVSVSGPLQQDLALPFAFRVFLQNPTHSDAHDVNVTLHYRQDVAVQSLPDGCTSTAA